MLIPCESRHSTFSLNSNRVKRQYFEGKQMIVIYCIFEVKVQRLCEVIEIEYKT